ncbi:hypothetical protein [Amycolatopsis albispora]|uniref:hypothetical protein n=1 Tax=Amycolatopsis albispora TaxID=1804986 RepID=UPI0019651C73|nr:hypothetical protein [Amycolatopsis albispora]
MSTPEHDLEKPTADTLDQLRPARPDQTPEPTGTGTPPLEADPADAADQREPAYPRDEE